MTESKRNTQPGAQAQAQKSWTWQEISEHNHQGSCWIYVGKDVYDVTKWLPKHPGGGDLVLLFSGRDCTEAFRAYHPFTDKPYAILEKFKIGELKGPSELVRWKDDTGFYKTVRERAKAYFEKNGLDPMSRGLFYEFYRMFSSLGVYLLIPWLMFSVFRHWPLYLRALFMFPTALTGVMIALNVGHFASHAPTYRMPLFNRLLGWFSFDVCLGVSWQIWLHEHVIGHHQYTNIITIDPNSPESHENDALYRSSPNQKWYKHFYYQFLWLPLLSFLLIYEYRFAPIQYWRDGRRKEVRVNRAYLDTENLLLFILGKVLWLLRTYLIPLYVWNSPLLETIFLVVSAEIVAGYFIGFSLPANHITDKVDWPMIVKDEKTGQAQVEQEWAIMQVKTCKDYAFDSWIFTNVFGSLNNHSCHHLMPAIHHTYYEQLYPIVKQTAKEFKVDLPDVGTYFDLIYDFLHNLWDLGYDPKKCL